MRPVRRDEIVDYQTYNARRAEELARILPIKAVRRIHVAPHLTLLCENRDTVRYQIQEMMRVEQLVKESAIVHEIATYNELLGGPGELGCTLLIEIADPPVRDAFLRRWVGLPEHLYVKTEGGDKRRATFDDRQVGDDRLSSVQYLKFFLAEDHPIAVGVDAIDLTAETALTPEQQQALLDDLRDGNGDR